MKNIILFDLDGTISDPKVGITKSIQYALRHFDIDVENADELCKFIGPPIHQTFKEFYGFNDVDVERAVGKFRERMLAKGLYENIMYDGVDAMLKELHESGKTLMIATSKPINLARKVLEYFAIDQFFAFVSGSEMNGDRSDKSEVIQYALEQNNIPKETSLNARSCSLVQGVSTENCLNISDCIMVGDRKHDIIGAKTNGLESIGALYGYGDYEELTTAGADYLVKDIGELSDLLHFPHTPQ